MPQAGGGWRPETLLDTAPCTGRPTPDSHPAPNVTRECGLGVSSFLTVALVSAPGRRLLLCLPLAEETASACLSAWTACPLGSDKT